MFSSFPIVFAIYLFSFLIERVPIQDTYGHWIKPSINTNNTTHWRRKKIHYIFLFWGRRRNKNYFPRLLLFGYASERARVCAQREKNKLSTTSACRTNISLPVRDLLIDEAHGTHSHCLFIFRTSGTCYVLISRWAIGVSIDLTSIYVITSKNIKCSFLSVVYQRVCHLASLSLLQKQFFRLQIFMNWCNIILYYHGLPLHDQMFKQSERKI